MDPGIKHLWAANITLQNATDGSQRLVKYTNNQHIKNKSVESNANSQFVQVTYKLEAPEIQEQL